MFRLVFVLVPVVLAILFSDSSANAQTHHHSASDEKPKPPKVFLDKNPRIVQYQLDRLDNARLLLVERGNDDKKYLPVHVTILKRAGIAAQDREKALADICSINESKPVDEILSILGKLDSDDRDQQQIGKQLIGLLLAQDSALLESSEESIKDAAASELDLVRLAGFALLIRGNETQLVNSIAADSVDSKISVLRAISMVPTVEQRNSLRPLAVDYLTSNDSIGIQRAALDALRSVTTAQTETFKIASEFVKNPETRRQAVRLLRKVRKENRDEATASEMVDFLVNLAEKTPTEKRTSNEFLESMELANQLLSLVSQDRSRKYRERLSQIIVRVVLIHTVEEEMRYDIPWFAVQAGSDIQLVLKNEDLMPHNLVITTPGALKDVALEGGGLGPKIGESGKQYVPVSDQVLHATRMVPSEQQDVMTFKAPTEPGEYPYVCTFPGHWMRMYGVMVVVDDLDAFERAPVEPKDPVGSDRALVKNWSANDLDGKFESGMKGRTVEIGKKLFTEATCAQCHIVAGEGKAVGPELTDIWSRWKNDTKGIFREIVEPSHKIEPKYVVRKVVTLDGEVISGIVVAEDKKTISILPNPESTEATIIQQDDIEDMMVSSVSIMPKGLLDRFTEDEIFEIMSYLKVSDPSQN